MHSTSNWYCLFEYFSKLVRADPLGSGTATDEVSTQMAVADFKSF